MSSEEAGRLLGSLRDFARRWFENCRSSRDGAGMGCALPACYGRSVCTLCGAEVLLIKEGERHRLTFFCPSCQNADGLELGSAPHRQRLSLGLGSCTCGQQPSVQLMRRPGKNFGRLHAICSRRKHAQQPGCAGQHRNKLHPQVGSSVSQQSKNIRKNHHRTVFGRKPR